MKRLNANYGGKQVNETEHALNSVPDDLTSARAKTWMTFTKLPWKAKRKPGKIQLIVHLLRVMPTTVKILRKILRSRKSRIW